MPSVFSFLWGAKFRGKLTRIIPQLSVSLFILFLICGVFVSQERKKIEKINDGTARHDREHTLTKKIGFIGISLFLALLCGYLIGKLF